MVVLIRNYSTLLLTLATARGLHSPLLIFLSPLALGSVWKLITLLCAVAKPGLRLWGHVHPLLYNNSKFYNVEKQSFVSSYGNKKLVHPWFPRFDSCLMHFYFFTINSAPVTSMVWIPLWLCVLVLELIICSLYH